MDVEAFFEAMPFADLLGVEVTEAADGHAEGHVEMRPELSWNADRLVAHGGVTFTLADTVGGAALVSLVEHPVPTVDMRIDYLEAGTGGLRAEADVVRRGGEVGTVDVDVYATGDDSGPDDGRSGDVDAPNPLVATARGVYRTG